jgi:CBS domain-containing protein
MTRELQSIAEDLKAGREAEPVTVRTFLWWFGAQRRGPNIVRHIRQELDKAGLVTVPDFEARWVDAPINFALALATTLQPEQDVSSASDDHAADEGAWVTRDATFRISKLAAANHEVVRITPDGTLAEAVTLLLARDFSQIAVMTSDRDVKGMVSWRSIGSRLALGKVAGVVRDFMEPHHEVRSSVSIFDAIPMITRHDYVLVRGEQNKITGIVTASDLSRQFQALSEPFLLLGEIENLIRNMIGEKFAASELAAGIDPGNPPRTVNSVDDLTFGDYIRLLQQPERWAQLGLAVDRVLFCKDLNAIREIRNDVTHFDPDGITSDEIERLRDFKSLLEMLEIIAH